MTRGRLRIYLGAAPGVGKTVAMLAEGARRASRGTDVVVALLETHERPYTASMADGLEVVPRRQVEYKGAVLSELDVDAVLARHPQVALVDELAHTNVPGSVNEKRWQDIGVLLDAGIDVISTVNIQHLESLNDAVESITGIAQQETVPDEVVRAADGIDLVDMSPEALRRRMAHGNIYKSAKVDAALGHYFRIGNLAALRELALLWLADRVEQGLEQYRVAHGIHATWPTRERVVVALSGAARGEILLRRGARITSRGAGGELLAVYVARGDGLAGPPLDTVTALRRLTEELGGTFHTVTGDDPAQAILDFARGVNASQVLIGSGVRTGLARLFSTGVADAVIAESGDIDVHVVTHPTARAGLRHRGAPDLSRRRVLLGLTTALCLPAFLTAVLSIAYPTVSLGLAVPLYILATVIVSLIGGLLPALLAAVASSLLVNWFFTPPVGTFTIADPSNVAALLVFLIVAGLVSLLVHTNSRRTSAALAAQNEAQALAELTNVLLGSTDQLALLLGRAVEMFGVRAAAVVRRGPTRQVLAQTGDFDADALAACESEAADADHNLVLQPGGLPAGSRRLFAAYAVHAGAILQRRALESSASSAEELARDNRARTALLSAVSHDLRTPLAGIKVAISSLRAKDVHWNAADEEELKEAIEDSADRLDALIGNLLDMSRLQAGALAVKPRLTDLGDVIPATIRSLGADPPVEWSIAPAARQVMADPGLLERVLGNMLENAVRYQAAAHPTEPVRVDAHEHGGEVEVRVVDGGVGVPAAQHERIFQPFQRYGDQPNGEGVGLGLAVARGLTEAMRGTLTAEETPGGGLTLVVTLPTRPGQTVVPAKPEDSE
jgi:two-component system, OmpR family, sensor histidine kinase KdpD